MVKCEEMCNCFAVDFMICRNGMGFRFLIQRRNKTAGVGGSCLRNGWFDHHPFLPQIGLPEINNLEGKNTNNNRMRRNSIYLIMDLRPKAPSSNFSTSEATRLNRWTMHDAASHAIRLKKGFFNLKKRKKTLDLVLYSLSKVFIIGFETIFCQYRSVRGTTVSKCKQWGGC